MKLFQQIQHKPELKLASAGLIALLLALVISGGAPVSAQDGSATFAATNAATLDANATLDVSSMLATPAATPTKKPAFALNRVKALTDATVLLTHQMQIAVTAELRSGKTFTQIATDNQLDPAAIKTAAIADLTAQVKTAVSVGQLTQVLADAQIKRLDNELTPIMTRVIPEPPPPAIAYAQAAITNILFQDAAKTMGISQRELLQALRGGQSLTQIATAHNIDPAVVVAAATKNATAYLNTRLKSTSLSQADTTELLNGLPTQLSTLMNKTNFLGEPTVTPTAAQPTDAATVEATLGATPAM